MKREIKFRGKNLRGEVVYGDLLRNRGEVFIAPDGVANPLATADDSQVIPETVGQLTALKDKNGADIYEGDILQMWLEDSVEPEGRLLHQMYVIFTPEKGFVLWGERMTMEDAEPLHEMLQWKECEIIGNIHDNPELMQNTPIPLKIERQ